MTIKSLLVKIGADISEFKTAMDGVQSKTAKMGQDMSSVGKTLSLGVSLPLLGVGVAATKMAMDAVESENLFEVSMGNMAAVARNWSNEVSESLGLNQYEVRKTVGTFNVMLKSMGQNEEGAYGMSKGLTQLSYDMSSFYNLRPEEAFEKLQAGISGEIEPLKRLGIVIREADVEAYALKHGISGVGKELTDAEKVQIRYNLIMERTRDAQGDLARTIDSPANQFRLLKSRVSEMMIEFGQNLLPLFKAGIGVLQKVTGTLSDMSDGSKKVAVLLGGITLAIGPALFGFGKLLIMLENIKKLEGKIDFKNFGLGAVGILAVATAAAIAYDKIMDLLKASEAADEAEARFNEQNAKLGQKLREAADAAGMTRAEFAQLTQKYEENYAALGMAIKKGQEGKALQEALAAAGSKHAEALDKQREAQEKLKKEEEAAAERTAKAKAAKEEYAKKIEEIYKQLPEMAKTARDEEMRATLSEYEYSKWALAQKYADLAASIPAQVAASQQGKATLLAMEKSYYAQLEAIENEYYAQEQAGATGLIQAALAQRQAYVAARIQAEADYITQLQDLQSQINEITMSDLQYKLWALDQERLAEIKKVQDSKVLNDTEKAELLTKLSEFYAAKQKLIRDDADFEKKLTEQLAADMQKAIGDFAGDALQALSDWGGGSTSILEGLGKAFQNLAQTALGALKSLISGIVSEAIKSIAASQAKAIAGVISSVMTTVPFPLNLALVGGAIAGVSALFSKIKLGEGGLVTHPTYALVGEKGPELVVPYDKIDSFMGRGGAGGGMNFHQTVHFHGDIKTDLDIDQISEKLARKTQEAIMRGRRY